MRDNSGKIVAARFRPSDYENIASMSERYRLPCPCGHETIIEPPQAGESVWCAGCGKDVEVPTLRGIRQLARAEEAAKGSAAASGWSPQQGVLYVIGLLLFLIPAGVIAYLLYMNSRLPTEQPDVANIQYQFDFDSLTPERSLEAWEYFATDNLETRSEPMFLWARNLSNRLMIGVAVLAALSFLGLVLMLVSLFWKPRPKSRRPRKEKSAARAS